MYTIEKARGVGVLITDAGGETCLLPDWVIGWCPDPDNEDDLAHLGSWTPSGRVEEVELLEDGWLARWSMVGCLDCGDWHHFESEEGLREWEAETRRELGMAG